MRTKDITRLALVLALAACRGKDGDSTDDTIDTNDTTTGVDADADGYTDDVDCNDDDPTISPVATEACDGVDQDCDGVADEGLPASTFYLDKDGDGFGDGATTVQACAAPAGFSAVAGDCNDNDPGINAGVELCDGLPNGCDTTGWDPAQEAGRVSYFPTSGPGQDITAALSGTDFSPGHWDAPADGTVKLCAGTFHGSIANQGHNLVIDGVDQAVSELSGGHAGRALEVTGGAVTVEDLTITGGFTSTPGGNVACTGGSVQLTRVRVTEGLTTAEGGGLYFANCPAVLTEVRVDNCAALQGGGIWFSSNQTWTNVIVEQNNANGGGAGAFGQGASLNVTGGRSEDNDGGTVGDGGAFLLNGVAGSIDGMSIRDNDAHRGAGAYLVDTDLTLANLEFRGNNSEDTGANLELRTGSTVQGTEVSFREGDASNGGNGGTIAVLDGSSLTLNGGQLRDNQGDSTGGFQVDNGTVTFFDTDFDGNDPNDARANGQGYTFQNPPVSGTCTNTTGCLAN